MPVASSNLAGSLSAIEFAELSTPLAAGLYAPNALASLDQLSNERLGNVGLANLAVCYQGLLIPARAANQTSCVHYHPC